jgi:hypothetical protein
VQDELVKEGDGQTAGTFHKDGQEIQIDEIQGKGEIDEWQRPRHLCCSKYEHGQKKEKTRQFCIFQSQDKPNPVNATITYIVEHTGHGR